MTAPRPPAIYVIADAQALAPTSVPEAVAAFVDAGVEWIQVRAKSSPARRLYEMVEACCRAVEGSQARLWVNDRPDVAALFPVDGIHVGQSDLPPGAVRRVVGEGCWIGCSTHSLDQLAAADRDPAVDVVALGPIFATSSKERPDPAVGLETLAAGRRATGKPLVAIGGIDATNVTAVLAAGADSAAVLGAACRPPLEGAVRRLAAAVEGQR